MRRAVFILMSAFAITVSLVGCGESAKTSDPKSSPNAGSNKLTPATMDSGGKASKTDVGGAKTQKMDPGAGAP